jgi:methylamine dehydrogenase accessory protein MauD
MHAVWIASNLMLWLVVLFLGFVLLGTLRILGRLRWQLQQLEATTPSRLGRRGLKRGAKVPDFSLPCVEGGEVALSSFAGHEVLLVFTQARCGPCARIVPELNRLHSEGDVAVLVVNNGDLETTQQWAREMGARFPVLAQSQLSVSRRYEVFATPFAFLINEQGVISSKGIVSERQHLSFVLSSAIAGSENGRAESELSPAEAGS